MADLYLVVLSARLNRQAVLNVLTALPDTGDWFYNLPNCFFIKSDRSASDLSKEIGTHFGNVRHFITRVDPKDRQGILPRKHWQRFYTPGL